MTAQAGPHLPSRLAVPDAVILAQSITVWQTVNAPYVLLPCALLLGALALRPMLDRRWQISWATFGLFGLLTGTSGLVLAAGALCVALCFALAATTGHRRGQIGPWIACSFGTGVGMLVSYTSPGARSRSEVLGNHPMLPSLTPGTLVGWVFPDALQTWEFAVLNPGTLIAGALLFSAAVVQQQRGRVPDPALLSRVGGLLLAGTILLSIINRASEVFAYPAFWHRLSTSTLVFIAICLLSFALGLRAADSFRGKAMGLAATLLFVSGTVAAQAASAMANTVQERYARWQSGPAPMSVISDTETWPADCWQFIVRMRDDAPARRP